MTVTGKEWFAPVSRRAVRLGRDDLAGIRVAEGMAWVTDGNVLLSTPVERGLRRNTLKMDVERSARKRSWRTGKWVRIDPAEAQRTRSLCWRGGVQSLGLRVVRVPTDSGRPAVVQAPLLHQALRGLDLTTLRVAMAGPLEVMRLSDGTRRAWVMPVFQRDPAPAPSVLERA